MLNIFRVLRYVHGINCIGIVPDVRKQHTLGIQMNKYRKKICPEMVFKNHYHWWGI